jgi:RNA polymerase-binding transcription factor DksA
MKNPIPQHRLRPVPACAFCSSCLEFAQTTLNCYRLCPACANSMRKNDN